MSKYKPLERYLRTSGKRRLVLTFPQIERLLGAPLPASARTYSEWWSNSDGGHVQSRSWRDPGYRTAQVDIPGEKLVFVADHASLSPAVNNSVDRASDALFGSMKGTTIVMAGVDLTQPTAPEWDGLSNE